MAVDTTIGVGIDGRPAKKGAKVVKDAFRDIRNEGKKVQGAIKAVDNAIFSLKGAFAGLSAIVATRALVQTEKNLQATVRGLESVTGSTEGAAKEMEFLAESADALGLNLAGIEKAYVGLAAASKGTALAGADTRNVFLGVSKAAATLGLSADATGGALVAVQQIISKGKVSAEELRQQLGERLPGAFQIAARSMGVSTEALDDMLKSGELLADDFIPKFARQLEEEFGEAAVKAAEGITGQLNRLDNAVLELGRTIASSGILDPLIEGAIELTKVLSNQDFLDATATAARALGEAISFAAANADIFLKIIVSLAALKVASKIAVMSTGFLEVARAATTAAAGSNTLVGALVAARVQMTATAAASRAAAAAMRALKAAIPFGFILLGVDALAAWAFGAGEAGDATDDLKTRVDALANSYQELTGARLEAAILDVQDRIDQLTEAETAANVAVEQLARRGIRSDEDLTARNEELTRARAAAEKATEDLYAAENLLSKLQKQAADNTGDLAAARKAAEKAAQDQKVAEAALAKVQGDAREHVQGLISDLNEQIATHGKGATETLRYQIANGELAETLRSLGKEGEGYAEVLLQLTGRLESLGPATRRGTNQLSESAKEMQRAREAADELISSLQQEVDLVGRTADQVDLYRVSVGDLASTFNKLPDGAEMAGRYLSLQKELRAATEAQDRFTEAQSAWAELVDQTINPVEDLNRQLGELYQLEALLTEQADELGLSQEQIYETVDRAATGIQEAYKKADEAARQNGEEMSQYAIQAARSIQNAFSDLFFDAMQGDFDNMGDKFKATLDRMVADLVSSQLLDFAGQQFGIGGLGSGKPTGGGGGGFDLSSIFSSIGTFFAPGSAVGNTFTVPGSGGHDSTMMLAPVTPGETVRISTPSQEEMAKRDRRGDVGDAPISVAMTINTPDANSFMASRGQIENSMLEMMQRGRRNS